MKFPLVILACLVTAIDADTTTESQTETTESRPTTGAVTGTEQPGITMSQACGQSSYYDSYGVIRSPNYPGYYYDYLYCDYYVHAPTGSSLTFIFKSFHVEYPDFVTISCPPNSNFSPREYSGHSLPDPVYISVCAQGKVNFRTDYTSVSSGFNIEYYVSDAGCGNTLFIGSNGFVNSPNWPEFYRSNENCSNIIWAPKESTINLKFRFFSLEDDCSRDWLEISCLDNPEFSPNRFCGSHGDYDLYIYKCSQVLLWFHSDGANNYQGFFIEYTIYSSTAAACGETSYFGTSGVITSPSYPGSYSNFLYCDYTIYASAGSSLVLIFESFNTQNSYDFVTISCPANSNVTKREYTGTDLPSPISISECSQGLVNFHTDASVVSSGFSLRYSVNEKGCGNTVYYPDNGYVNSPNWPSNYGYSQDCANIIYSLGRNTFFLQFYSFILQSCCSCDWLEISCLDNSDYGPTRYCGSYPYFDTYINNCSQVLLWFHSDDSGNDQGFHIWYNIYPNVDDGKVPSKVTLNATENVPINGKPNVEERIKRN